jgi:hypothetical protein
MFDDTLNSGSGTQKQSEDPLADAGLTVPGTQPIQAGVPSVNAAPPAGAQDLVNSLKNSLNKPASGTGGSSLVAPPSSATLTPPVITPPTSDTGGSSIAAPPSGATLDPSTLQTLFPSAFAGTKGTGILSGSYGPGAAAIDANPPAPPSGGIPPGPAQQAQTPAPYAGSGTNNATQPGDKPIDTFTRNTTANAATGAGPLSIGASATGTDPMSLYAQGKIDYATMQQQVNAINAKTGQTGLGANPADLALFQKQAADAERASSGPSSTDPGFSYGVQGTNATPTTIDQWWAQHGTGDRFTGPGNTVDLAQAAFDSANADPTSGLLASMSPELQALFKQNQKDRETAAAGAATHGGYWTAPGSNTPNQNPNAQPLTQTPSGSFVNAQGQPATQGGTGAPAAPTGSASGVSTPGIDLSTIQSALAQLAKSSQTQADTQAASQRTRDQQIQDLMNEYVTPGRQTSANNDDPFSGVTTIDPSNDLRSTVITDTPDARTASYADQVDQAAKALPTDRNALASTLTDSLSKFLTPTDVTAGAAVNPNTSDRLAKLQALVDGAAGSLSNVDRFKLAQDKFDTYANATDPAYQLDLRRAAQRASAAGGLFGGKLRTDYGNLDLARSRDLDNQRSTLFQNALEGSIQDALNKENALSGLEGQLSGEEANQRNEQRAERQYGTDVATGNVSRALAAKETAAQMGQVGADAQIGNARSNLAALSGLENTSRAANQRSIDDLRSERANQVSQEENAFERQLAQYQTEQQAKQQKFQNGLQLLGAGSVGNPASTLMTAAGQVHPELDAQAIQQLMTSLGRNAAKGANGSTGSPISADEIQQLIKSGLFSLPSGNQGDQPQYDNGPGY